MRFIAEFLANRRACSSGSRIADQVSTPASTNHRPSRRLLRIPPLFEGATPSFFVATIKATCANSGIRLVQDANRRQYAIGKETDMTRRYSTSTPWGLALLAGSMLTLRDRKSTRLNSSYVKISYAVF